MVCVGHDGRFIDVNDAFCRSSGYSREELLSMTVHDIDPDYSAEIWPEFWEKLKQGGSLTFESCHRTKDGKVSPVEITANFFEYNGKEYHCSFARDITERKRAEEALQAEKDKLEAVTENIGAGLAIISKDFRTLWANQVLKEIFGEVEGKICYSTYNQRNQICPACGVQEIFETGKDKVVHEQVGKDKDDNTIWSQIVATPIRDQNGNVTAALELVVPITERKQAEEALREERDKAQTYLDIAGVVFVVVNADHKVALINKKGCETLGFEEDEIIGKDWFDNFLPERIKNEVKTVFESLISGKAISVEYFENPVLTKSGEERTIAWHNILLKDEAGNITGTLSSGENITEKKKMETQLIQAERLSAVGTLAYGIAHEFNNILAGILGNAEFGMGNDDPEEAKECFRIIMESCDRAKSITKSLLAFSRQRETKKQRADVTSAVETILGLVERELEKHNIKVVRKFSPIPEIVCDLGELSGAVLNMITNARDAMKPKGGTLTIEIGKKKDDTEIIFTDTGCGIPDSIKSKIFEPFVTTKGALGQSEIPGTGLGLFLSYGIIKRYDGEIGVKSEVGKGSTFTIRIPISKNQVAPALVKGEEEKPMDVPKNLHILLVDDEQTICSAIKRVFERKGHSVTTALSGKKGLEIFKKGSFDLVLTDITMPDMDGLELISKLKKIDPQLKFIVLTGHITEDMFESAKRAGVHEVLVKPFRNEELYQAVGRVFST